MEMPSEEENINKYSDLSLPAERRICFILTVPHMVVIDEGLQIISTSCLL